VLGRLELIRISWLVRISYELVNQLVSLVGICK